MTTAAVNLRYTAQDHALREHDRYARAKYHLTLRWLRSRLENGSLLYNIGVGSGYFNHLAVRRGVSVVGCEPDEAAFRRAVLTRPAGDCEIVHANLTTFARYRPPADVVVMHDVLEHIEDDAQAVREVRALVRPGGKAIVSVPAIQTLYGRHDVELGHYRRYSQATLTAVLAPHFKIKRLRHFGMASLPLVLYFSVIKRTSYPKAASSENLISGLYGAVCALESYLPEPIGTSLIAELEPRT